MTPKAANSVAIDLPGPPPGLRPRCRQQHPFGRATPVQLALFPEQVALTRIRPELNERRYYQIEIQSDLFGRVVLARRWGRIGRSSRIRLEAFADFGSALNALASLAASKRRRGYQDDHRG